MDRFWSAPPVTRSLTALTFVQSALVYGGLLSGRYVIFRPGLVFKQLPEAWRLFSSFFMTGPRLDFILDIYFMFKYGSALETASPRFSSPGDFFTYVFFVATVITLTAGCLLDDVIFTHALIIAFVYTFAQDNQGRKASFFVVQLPVEFLPWAMLTWTLVLSGWHAAFSESMGIVAAHMYDFFSRIYPTFGGGRNYIITPTVVRRIFSAHMPPVSTGPMEQLIVRSLKNKIHPRAGALFKAPGAVEDQAEDWAAAKTAVLYNNLTMIVSTPRYKLNSSSL